LKSVFVDTAFWVSFFNDRDSLHPLARNLTVDYNDHLWVTTDAVLWETLNFYSRFPKSQKIYLAEQLEMIFSDTNIEIITSGQNWLRATAEFYRKRADKEWSGVDCFSMLVMQSKNIQAVLTTDQHFRQAGFYAVMLEPQA
jgi:uncharacterized protein